LDRIRTLTVWREPTAGPPPAPSEQADSIRYAFAQPDQDALPRSLIGLLGEAPPNVGEVLESVATACRANGEFPVAVMSELRPGLIATATVPIEFMPARHYLPVEAGQYERHLRRRWSLMTAKWAFAKHVEMGLGFEDFLHEQLSASDPPDVMPAAASR
jgi:hypothetical protein